MIVYLTAFILTIIFIRLAALYYNRYQRARKPCPIEKMRVEESDSETPIRKQTCYTHGQIVTFQLKYYWYFFLAFFPLFFISAVRYDVGTDYLFTYYPNFLRILQGEMPYSEWGFNVFNQAIQLFTSDPQWLFVITSFVFTFLLIRTIVHFSNNAAVSVLVLLVSCIWFWSLNNIRQAIAVVIMFAAFPYLVKRKLLKYLVCMLLALIFHWSALVMILPFVAVNIRFIKKYFLYFVILALILMPILCKLLEVIVLQTKYAYFFESDLNNSRSNTVNIIYNLIVFVMAYFVLNRYRVKDKTAYVLLCMQFFTFWVASTSLFIRVSELISRLTMFCQVFQLLLVPYCCKMIDDKGGRLVFVGSYVLIYAIYMVYYIVLQGYHQVLPYYWIF